MEEIDRTTFAELQAAAGAEFVAELVDTFLEEAPQMLAELRRALAEGNADRFRRAAHSLKSNSHTFGAFRLAELARALELGGLEAGRAPDALRELADEYAHTASALRGLRDA